MKQLYLTFLLFCLSASYGWAQPTRTGEGNTVKILNCYPNPATSQINFTIELNGEQNHTIQIYNLLGKLVHEEKQLSPRTTIQLADFLRGMYIYQLKDKNGKLISTGKFQVSK